MNSFAQRPPLLPPVPKFVRSLVVDEGVLDIRLRETPPVQAHDVLIQVGAVGLCRTDLAVMCGKISVSSPLIPGHEFAGEIILTGCCVSDLQPGQRVAVNPVLPCGECRFCLSGTTQYCRSPRFLGLDLDGACSDFVIVPATAVYAVPDDLPFTVSAFAEPVAASLGVLNANITPAESGAIIGDNRIGRLTQRVLRARGFSRIDICSAADADSLPDDEYDYAIETEATPDVLAHLLRIIRPRGRMILKSRNPQPVPLDFRKMLPKEPVLYAVNYGSFDEAVRLLVDQQVRVDDLIGTCWPLARYLDAIVDSQANERNKTFLLPNEE